MLVSGHDEVAIRVLSPQRHKSSRPGSEDEDLTLEPLTRKLKVFQEDLLVVTLVALID